MAKTKIQGYSVTNDPFAPNSLFDGGEGGGDLPEGTEGQILVNRAGEWQAEDPDFPSKEDLNKVSGDVAALTDRVDAAAEQISENIVDISTNKDSIDALSGKLDREAIERRTADEGITTRLDAAEIDIDNLQGETDTLDAGLKAETKARTDKDTEIDGRIDTLNQSVTDCLKETADLRIELNGLDTKIQNEISTEKTAREKADAALDTRVTKNEGDIAGMQTKLVPAGGTKGQALVKASGNDYETEWIDVGGGSTFGYEDITNKVLTAELNYDDIEAVMSPGRIVDVSIPPVTYSIYSGEYAGLTSLCTFDADCTFRADRLYAADQENDETIFRLPIISWAEISDSDGNPVKGAIEGGIWTGEFAQLDVKTYLDMSELRNGVVVLYAELPAAFRLLYNDPRLGLSVCGLANIDGATHCRAATLSVGTDIRFFRAKVNVAL